MASQKHDVSELSKIATAGGAAAAIAKVAVPVIVEYSKAPTLFGLIKVASALFPVVQAKIAQVVAIKDVAWPEAGGEALDLEHAEAQAVVSAFFKAAA